MSQLDTAYFSSLCEQLYNPKSAQEREQAQLVLEKSFPTFTDSSTNSREASIQSPTDTASALRVLLENSPSPYVQTFCFSRLKVLVQAQFALFSQEAKVQLRKYFL
jgi:exportin-7